MPSLMLLSLHSGSWADTGVVKVATMEGKAMRVKTDATKMDDRVMAVLQSIREHVAVGLAWALQQWTPYSRAVRSDGLSVTTGALIERRTPYDVPAPALGTMPLNLMTFAISLKSVNSTADPIRSLWEQVSLYEGAPSMAALDYPPHITLAVYDDVDPALLKAALRRSFTGRPTLRLTFRRLCFFDSNPLVLWADSSPSPTLAEAYSAVHACIDPAKCHRRYRPGAWIPHCTLGTQIKYEHRAEAVAFTARSIETFDVLFDVADCVSFPPVAVLDEQTLT